MQFDFDTVIDRRGTRSSKWDDMAARTGADAPDAIAMWVADMDFRAPPCVRDALRAEVDRGVFGYYARDEGWRAAVAGWLARRHGWTADPDWITPSPGLCAALAACAHAFAAEGEGVVIFPPVYHAFARVIRAAGRRVIDSPLRLSQGRHVMDLDALRRDLPADARMAILCSPHNPGGRVWDAEELAALADLCVERGLVLVSDEIHHDLVFTPARHTVTALAAPGTAGSLVTLAAPSKTFNLAGLDCGEAIIADAALRARYRAAARSLHVSGANALGMIAAEAAYAGGDGWLDALLPRLAANRDRFAAGLAEAVPGARMHPMAATYLAWVDFRETGLAHDALVARMTKRARIGASEGRQFGAAGEGWMRFNLACPPATLDAALGRIADAFADLRQ